MIVVFSVIYLVVASFVVGITSGFEKESPSLLLGLLWPISLPTIAIFVMVIMANTAGEKFEELLENWLRRL